MQDEYAYLVVSIVEQNLVGIDDVVSYTLRHPIAATTRNRTHYVKTRRNPQNRKYRTHCNASGGFLLNILKIDDVQSQQQQRFKPPIGCQIVTNINGCK